MDLLLVGVTVVSLGLAITMSIVAWTLLRNERERSAARVEALEALAFAEPAAEPAPIVERRVETREPVMDDDNWDLALAVRPSRDIEHLAHPIRHEPSRSTAWSEPMFENEPASGVAGRRWLAIAAIVLVIGAGVATISALRSPELIAAIEASRPKPSQTVDGRPLELLSLRHSTEADGTFTITGLVQNPSDGKELDKVDAVVYLFDDSGRFFAQGRAGLDVSTVQPGDESPFVVKIANAGGIGRYRVGFRRGDGRVVAHVDRRGQLPSGTTGDTLGDELELARPAGGMRPVERPSTR